jgi:gliding motility-associated-like protein
MANIIAGPGITISNAVYSGPAISSGSFNGSASNIGINSGVLLTCGDINLAIGPNNLGSQGVDNLAPGNADLNGIAGATTYDAVELEFDFVTQSNNLSFRYVFGSEEYPEWVNSGFNDAFAFYISGPGIPGSVNIGVVPGTGLPVTIDNINAGFNSQYYVNNAGGATIQYDGFTTVLTATRQVTACETYHLRLTIADGGDGIYDSGVFIEENSLISNVVQISASTVTADSTAWEGCSDAIVTFTLGATQNTPYVIDYTLAGTATNGSDYTNLPGSITIPANTLSNSFTIVPTVDGIPEPQESVIIIVQTSICSYDTIEMYIDDLDPLTVTAYGDTSLCNGIGQATIYAIADGGGGGYTYSWSNGAGINDSATVAPGTTTTYTITVDDACGVTQVTDDVTVTIAAMPVANAGPDITYCAGDAVTLTASGGISYEWFKLPGNTSEGTTASIDINPVGNEDYYVEVNSSGCIAYDTVSVTENPAALADAGADVAICENDVIQLPAAGGVQYDWAPAADLDDATISNPTFSGTTTTTLTVTVTDANGCTDTDDVEVTVNPLPPADAGADIIICLGFTTPLDGSGGTQYSWNPATDLDDATIAAPTFSGLVSTTYTLTVTDNNGCVATDDVYIDVMQNIPVADFVLPTQTCVNDDVTITFTGTASPTALYDWNFNGGVVTAGNDEGPYTLHWTTTGTKTVECIVDENGCGSDTITYNIDVFAYPVPNAGANQSLCSDDVVSLGGSSIPDEDYQWTPATYLSDATIAAPDLTPLNLTPATVVLPYVLTVTSQNGCVARDTALITVFPIPIANYVAPAGECFDINSIDFTAGGVYGNIASFAWDFGNFANPTTSTQENPNGVVFSLPDDYQVSLTITENGCVSLPSVQTVEIFPMPVADFSANPLEGCEPLDVFFTDLSDDVGSNLAYDWKFGDDSSSVASNPRHTYINAGVYDVQVTVTTGDGCSNTTIKPNYITVYPRPVAGFKANPESVSIFDPRIIFTDQSTGADSCEYIIGETGDVIYTCNFEYHFEDTGYYTITQYVYSIHGCKDTAKLDVYVKPEFTFYIPNAFSPNADFNNDIFYGYGTFIKEYDLTVLNRWGQMLFRALDVKEGWDGTYNGEKAQEDVYVYKVNIIDINGEKHEFIGKVTLFR